MDMSKAPDDFFMTSHQFTKKAYRDQYPAIDPASPALSQKGKAFAAAFAKANAKAIVLVARNADQLRETEQDIRKINDQVQVLSVPTNIIDEGSVEKLFEKIKSTFGKADILVNNAGTVNTGPIDSIDTKAWWSDFEMNVKGTFLMTKAFLQLVGTEKPAVIVNITSGIGVVVQPGMSCYGISKLAMIHLQRFVAVEHPNVVAIAVSPGTVLTDMTLDSFKRFSKDTPELVGGFTVWLATDKAKFLNGRYVCVQWSVDELLEREDEIVKEEKLLTGLNVKLGTDQFE